jgi:hypothetical protein
LAMLRIVLRDPGLREAASASACLPLPRLAGEGGPAGPGEGVVPVAKPQTFCLLSPESDNASPPPLPPLPGHPLPRSLGGEGKASVRASLVSSTFSVKNKGARASTPAMRAGGSRTAVSFIPPKVAASAIIVNCTPRNPVIAAESIHV